MWQVYHLIRMTQVVAQGVSIHHWFKHFQSFCIVWRRFADYGPTCAQWLYHCTLRADLTIPFGVAINVGVESVTWCWEVFTIRKSNPPIMQTMFFVALGSNASIMVVEMYLYATATTTCVCTCLDKQPHASTPHAPHANRGGWMCKLQPWVS